MSIEKSTTLTLALAVFFLISACEQERTSGIGLHLPTGNIENGKTAFTDLKCQQCHSVANVELPPPELLSPLMNLPLGGEVYRVKTYGELVTSIINPKHIISNEYLKMLEKPRDAKDVGTPMPSSNEEMTVAQLIDLVTFLDSHYQRVMPDYRSYDYIY